METHLQRAMQALQKIASEQGLRVFQVQQVKSQETGTDHGKGLIRWTG